MANYQALGYTGWVKDLIDNGNDGTLHTKTKTLV